MKRVKIALDTNILIYFLEGIEPYAGKVEDLLNSFMKGEKRGVISTITLAEVLTGFYVAGDEERAVKVKSLFRDLSIDGLEIVPVTFEVADLAARLRAEKGGKLPDSLIVATALNQAASVIISQDEDLQRFRENIKIFSMPP